MTTFSRLAVLALSALPACSRSAPKPPESAASSTTSSAVASTAASGTPEHKAGKCPRTGLWALCSVETRLVQSGFVVRHLDGETPQRRAGFSVMPALYTLGRTRLEVFIYPSESAVSSDVARIDTAFAAPRGTKSPWGVGVFPTFVRSGNLAAVFLTDNPTQAERLTLALTAGAPQP
jgi:hypothetical protein